MKPFIIADIGSNWERLDDLKDSIALAKNVGADAVKFQFYTAKELYGIHKEVSHELPAAHLLKLKEKADACGIEFMCTAFSPEGVKLIDPIVGRHKVASSDLSYPPLLQAIAKTGKPVILSVGASSITDIRLALVFLDPSKVTLLYCIANYPATNVCLFGIEKLRREFPEVAGVGYSCHTKEWTTPVEAVKNHGATVIEKHFRIRSMKTPDSNHSLDVKEFQTMVKAIKDLYDVPFPDRQEDEAVELYNRRLIATQDIAAGQVLDYGKNYGIFRSTRPDREGFTGFAWQHLNGKTVNKALKAGDAIGPGVIG